MFLPLLLVIKERTDALAIMRSLNCFSENFCYGFHSYFSISLLKRNSIRYEQIFQRRSIDPLHCLAGKNRMSTCSIYSLSSGIFQGFCRISESTAGIDQIVNKNNILA